MKQTAGIRELKQNASAVVAQVVAGESVTITDRGRPVAQIVPLHATALERKLQAGIARAAKGSLAKLPTPEPGPNLSGAVIESRASERY